MNEIQKVQENTVSDEQQKSIFDPQAFNHMMMVADTLSKTDFVPDIYKNNTGNCFIATQYAARLNTDPVQFMQNSYIVHGKPGIQSVFAIGLANESNLIEGTIQYKLEGSGGNRSCTAYAKLKTGDVVEAVCDMAMVRAEGWDKKAGSKWKTMPDQMLKYRSAMFLIRASFPNVILGMQSKEELVDTVKTEKNITNNVSKLDLNAVKQPEVKKEYTPPSEDVTANRFDNLNEEITFLFKRLTKEKQDAVKQTQKSVKDMSDEEKAEMIEYLNILIEEGSE